MSKKGENPIEDSPFQSGKEKMEKIVENQSKTFGVRFIKSKAFHDAIARIGIDLYAKNVLQLEELANPSETVQALKYRYWKLIGRGLLSDETFTSGKLYEGICTYTFWYNDVLSSPEKVAWIITLDANYMSLLEILKGELLEKLSELIRLPVIKNNNTVDYKRAKFALDTLVKLFEISPTKTP